MMHPNQIVQNLYPTDAHPLLLRNLIAEAAAKIGVTHGAAAMAALMMVSASMSGKAKVRTPHGQEVNAVVYGLLVGESGDRKSALMRHIALPIREHDEAKDQQHALDMASYEAKCSSWSAVQDGLMRKLSAATKKGQPTEAIRRELEVHIQGKPMKPRLRRLIRTDVSKRAFIEVLEGKGEAIALVSDEASIVLNSELIGESGVVNVAWDGGTLTLDRGNGTSIVARSPYVTAFLMLQPEVMRTYIERHGEAARGSGFLARFLVAWPPSLKGYRFIQSAEPSQWEHLEPFHERVRELLRELAERQTNGACTQTVLEFDDEAKARWVYIANGIEAAMQPGGYLNDISDFAAKAMENIARVAALFHVFARQDGKITTDTLERAHAVVAYHLNEVKRIFADEPMMAEAMGDAQKLEHYLHRLFMAGHYQVRRNDVYRNGPIRHKGRFGAAVDWLLREGKIWLVAERNKTLLIQQNPQYFSAVQPN